MDINDKQVWVYREVFSTVFEPLERLKTDQEEINYAVKNALFFWGNFLSYEDYNKLAVIDAGQKVVRMANKANKTIAQLNISIPAEVFSFPDLRCPLRTKDKTDSHLWYFVNKPQEFIGKKHV